MNVKWFKKHYFVIIMLGCVLAIGIAIFSQWVASHEINMEWNSVVTLSLLGVFIIPFMIVLIYGITKENYHDRR
jgi:membrane protein DedA with SNARE-associated domain